MERCCSSFFTRLRISTSLCRCSTNCRRSRCSRSGVHSRGNRPFHQQFQNMRRVPLVRLLLAHVTGPDLRRIPDPDHVPQILHHFHEPLTVPRRFHPNQHRRRQLLHKTASHPRSLHQLAFAHSPVSLSSQLTCCQLGWKSHPIIIICEGSFLPSVFVLKPQTTGSNRAFALIQSILVPPFFGGTGWGFLLCNVILVILNN